MSNIIRMITVLTGVFLFISTPSFADAISPQVAAETTPETEIIQQPAIAEAGFNKGRVARGVFTTDVVDREPVDNLTVITNDVATVKYFTDLREMSGHKVIHRWMRDGEVVSEVEFQVKGPRWRIWSSKNMQPGWLGKWSVAVINTVGEEIEMSEFEYTESTVVETPVAPESMSVSP